MICFALLALALCQELYYFPTSAVSLHRIQHLRRDYLFMNDTMEDVMKSLSLVDGIHFELALRGIRQLVKTTEEALIFMACNGRELNNPCGNVFFDFERQACGIKRCLPSEKKKTVEDSSEL